MDQRNPNIEIKPIEVNFESVINENSSDEEESEMPMPDFNITLCQSSNKKTRSDAKLFWYELIHWFENSKIFSQNI